MSSDIEVFRGIYPIFEFKVICNGKIEGDLPVRIRLRDPLFPNFYRGFNAARISAPRERNNGKSVWSAVLSQGK